MKKDKEIEAFIYIVKYKGQEPSITVDGDTNDLVAMAMSVICEDEIFMEAIRSLVEIEENGGIEQAIESVKK